MIKLNFLYAQNAETYFDIITCKIEAKLNFSSNFSPGKIKLKICQTEKIRKLFLHTLLNIAHLFGTINEIWTLLSGEGGGGKWKGGNNKGISIEK